MARQDTGPHKRRPNSRVTLLLANTKKTEDIQMRVGKQLKEARKPNSKQAVKVWTSVYDFCTLYPLITMSLAHTCPLDTLIKFFVTKHPLKVWSDFWETKCTQVSVVTFALTLPNPEYGQSQPTERHPPMDWLGCSLTYPNPEYGQSQQTELHQHMD